MKKNIFIAVICIILLFSLTGCKNKNTKNKVQELPKKEVKINLNNNVYYISDIRLTNKNCGGFGFPKNVEETIDAKWISTYINMKAVDLLELKEHNITWDTKKETEALKEWNKLTLPTKGIHNLTFGYENHEFYFGYDFIELSNENGTDLEKDNPYYELNREMIEERETFEKSAYNIISSRDGYRLSGTCGGPKISGQKLDENTCKQYNLVCDRW